MKYNPDDLCVVVSNTSSHNGHLCKVINYTNKSNKDIVKVQDREGKIFNIKESSLRRSNSYDILRSMTNYEIKSIIGTGIRRKIVVRILSYYIKNFKFILK